MFYQNTSKQNLDTTQIILLPAAPPRQSHCNFYILTGQPGQVQKTWQLNIHI